MNIKNLIKGDVKGKLAVAVAAVTALIAAIAELM